MLYLYIKAARGSAAFIRRASAGDWQGRSRRCSYNKPCSGFIVGLVYLALYGQMTAVMTVTAGWLMAVFLMLVTGMKEAASHHEQKQHLPFDTERALRLELLKRNILSQSKYSDIIDNEKMMPVVDLPVPLHHLSSGTPPPSLPIPTQNTKDTTHMYLLAQAGQATIFIFYFIYFLYFVFIVYSYCIPVRCS